MLSISTKPITTSKLDRDISLEELVNLIQQPKNIDLYHQLHQLRINGKDEECKSLKQKHIPWVTPNSLLRGRKLTNPKDFLQNFKKSTGYIYFDLDDIEQPIDSYKKKIVSQYGEFVTIISKSSTNRGISILVRINVPINTVNEFQLIYDYVYTTYFPSLPLDHSVRKLNTTWFIPYDSDVFFNQNSIIHIPDDVTKGSKDVIWRGLDLNIHSVNPKNPDFYTDSIRDVFQNCRLETPIYVEDKFKISPTPILQIRYPNIIKDGFKRKVYRRIISDFIELNPTCSLSMVFQFINHINENFAHPKMNLGHLKYIVVHQWTYIHSQKSWVNDSTKRMKCIHYHKSVLIPRKIKIRYSKQLQGLLERYKTFKKIQNSINFLLDEHDSFTYNQISDLLCISISTVKRYINKRKHDFENEYLEFINDLTQMVEKYTNEKN
jgi:hypothetical protein